MKKIILIHFIILFNISFVRSQVAVPSPNVGSISEKAIIPVSGFTGQADVTIPLYTVKYKDIQVPITLNYNTQGNKVKEHPTFVGLGFSMSSGGLIYRKVNGLVDEHPKRLLNIEYDDQINYLSNADKVTSNYNDLDYIKKYALDGVDDFFSYAYDGMPDEFVFNFNGYSGVFYFARNPSTGNMEPVFRPNGNYNLKGEIVEIKDNLRVQSSGGNGENFTVARCIYSIKITDDLGFVYLFGNAPENIEFGNAGNLNDDNYNTANAWHLSKITAPVGYSIDFQYEKKGKLIIPDAYKEVLATNSNVKFSSYAQIIIAFSVSWGSSQNTYTSTELKSSYYFNYPSYLKSIKTPEQEILFEYSQCNDLKYDLSKYYGPNFNQVIGDSQFGTSSYWQKLDDIKVSNINKTIKFIYTENEKERLKLNQIIFGVGNNALFTKEKDFSFNYNILKLPSYESNQSDHWGYYNGKNREYDENNYYGSREPDGLYLEAEMLELIQYPNRGYMKLGYEPHYYNKIARQFPFVVDTVSSNVLAGGLRIKSIEAKTDINTLATRTDYYYNKNYVEGGTVSSGILSGIPKYANSGSRYISYSSNSFWAGASGSAYYYYQIGRDKYMFPLSTTNGNHVTYTEVTEKTNNGYISTTYTNHDNGYLDRSPTLMHSNFDSETIEDPFISNQAYRGLPLFIKTYSQQGILIKEKQNLFITDQNGIGFGIPFIQRVAEDLVGGHRASSGRYPMTPALISKTIEKDLLDQNSISTSVTYEYNIHNKINKETSLNSKGETLIKEYLYADRFAVSPNIYDAMVKENLVGLPIETTQYMRKTGSMDKIVGSSITSYNRFNDLILPEKLLTLNVKNGQTYNATVGMPGYLPYDLNYTEGVKFNRYDDKGNILELQQTDGTKKAYLWGYGKQYPVAEIIGSEYSAVSDLINQSILDNPASDEQLMTELDKLRTDLPAAQINTYTYKPLFGVTSNTDIRGKTTYYEYDSFQRLKYIRDKDRNIVKSFCYSYAGQLVDCNVVGELILKTVYNNTLKSKSFLKSDCSAGTGSSVIYTVNAGKYSSMVSQADADQKAQEDIDMNGQAYANSNGTCLITIYARVERNNYSNDEFRTDADVYIKFYSNPECTIPYILPYSLTAKVYERYEVNSFDFHESDSYVDYAVPIGVSSYFIGRIMLESINTVSDPWGGQDISEYSNWSYELKSNGNVYIPLPTL